MAPLGEITGKDALVKGMLSEKSAVLGIICKDLNICQFFGKSILHSLKLLLGGKHLKISIKIPIFIQAFLSADDFV